jgi:hypothetical protein
MEFLDTAVTFCPGHARGQRLRFERARMRERGQRGRGPAREPNAWDKFQDFGHIHWHNALMWGDGVEKVSITGPGLIHGRGLVRNHNDTTPKGSGDKAISLKNSRNVVIRDVSILHGGWFAILATGVERGLFTLRSVTDFLLRNSPGLPDVKRATVEKESF